MARPTKPSIALTNESLLAIMQSGRTYSAYALARKFGLTTQEVRPTLDALVKSRELIQCRASNNSVNFKLPAQDDRTTGGLSQDANGSRPATGIFAGVMKGYDAEFDRRASLCMLARRT
ncbi:hypothetical protein AWB78_07354 [Caballeronia calidae]|uniref:Uncharacterized protein n=1 Tax=Caballeronia calidae TaxID=1777139 RepID=A0A158EER1_9BURK|nr:hypothetical protein AWB78_07354 [Caballeronia calidae]